MILVYLNIYPVLISKLHCFFFFESNLKFVSSDAKCGLLHCEGGMRYPRIASSNFIISNVNTREGSVECK
jgi:hypothetical protein